jgi:protein required for attachment to host cells
MISKNMEQLSESVAGTHAFVKAAPATTWVIVADAETVMVFSRRGKDFELVREMNQPDLRIDGLDNKGRGRGGVYGAGRHAYEPSMQEGRQAEMALARETVSWLDKEFDTGAFKELVLVAAPKILGELRRNLSGKLSDTVILSIDKQLTGFNSNGLKKELLRILQPAD